MDRSVGLDAAIADLRNPDDLEIHSLRATLGFRF